MMNTMNITQNVLRDSSDHFPDKIGNKIKLKDESYSNCIRHIENVPFHVEAPSQVISPKTNLNVLYNENMDFRNGARQPIGVKESMLTNIESHAKVRVDSVSEVGETVINHPVEENKIIDFPASTSISSSDSGLSVNDRFNEISNARQLVQDAMTRADQAEQEAKQSEETLNKLSIEDAETQKKLEEAETRKSVIEEKIIAALNSQADTLANTRKKYEDLIVEANNRRDQSIIRIEDVRNRIQSTNERLSQVENEIASQQQILDALSQLEISSSAPTFNDSDILEDYQVGVGRRVA